MDEDVNTVANDSEANVAPSVTQNTESVANSSSSDSLDAILDKAFSDSADSSEEAKEEQGEEIPEKAETEPENSSRGEERKEQLQREIRDSAAELSRLKAEISQYQELQLPSVEELTNYIMSQDEDISEADAIIEARLRLAEAQNSRQAEIETIAETRHEQALAAENARLAYPELFDDKDPNFNSDLANGIMQMYEDVAGVKRAEDGGVISATVGLQPFLDSIGQIYRLGVMRGEQAKNAHGMKNKSKKVDMSYIPSPRSNNASHGEMTEDDFVKSVLDD